MKKNLSILLLLGLLVSLGSMKLAAKSNNDKASNIEPFRLEALDPTLSVFEAVKEHPEILDTFCITPLTSEDAQQMIAEGMRCFELDDNVSAVDLLSSLSARKAR